MVRGLKRSLVTFYRRKTNQVMTEHQGHPFTPVSKNFKQIEVFI